MRVRDLGILILAFVGILLSLQGNQRLGLKPSFYHEIDTSLFANAHYPTQAERLPPPVVTDVDGDGKQDIIVVTREPKVKILDASKVGAITQRDVTTLEPIAESTLLGSVGVTSGRIPIAVAAGYLDKPPAAADAAGAAPRRQVIVVVTQGWSVLCFDHTLKLLWVTDVQENFPAGHFAKEVSAIVLPNTVRKNDKGMVVVGGRMEFDHTLETYRAESTRKDTSPSYEDGDDDADDDDAAHDEFHFSYYALDGKTGRVRWKHEADDFHGASSAHDEFTIPQHNYKLEIPANVMHAGEVDWREFRDHVLGMLRHRWELRDDTRFRPAHFERTRINDARAAAAAKEDEAGRDTSLDATHLTTLLSDLLPRSADDADWKPNVLFADLSDGVEVVHLFTGRPVCQLTLARGVHADINHDGVVDHAEAIVGEAPTIRVHDHLRIPSCYGMATSGIPPREELFNGTICHSGMPLTRIWHQSADDGDTAAKMDARTPVLVERLEGGVEARRVLDVVFYVSSGKVTSYDHAGHLRWQTSTDSAWLTPETLPEDGVAAHLPDFVRTALVVGVQSVRLHADALHEHLLVSGQDVLSLLDVDGEVLASTKLVDSPVARAVVADFTNDGWSDVIVTTRAGYYGYTLERRAGSMLFTSLVGVLLVAMGGIFLSQYAMTQPAGGAKKRVSIRRSTDD